MLLNPVLFSRMYAVRRGEDSHQFGEGAEDSQGNCDSLSTGIVTKAQESLVRRALQLCALRELSECITDRYSIYDGRIE